MLNSIVTATLLSEVMSKFAKSDVAHVIQPLINRATKAKNDHDIVDLNPNDSLELARNKCLESICDIQHEVVLCVSNSELVKKILPLTLDQIGNTYEAKTSQEIKIVEIGLARLNNAIEAYKKERKRRKKVSLIAVLVSFLGLVGIGLFITLTKQTINANLNMLALPIPVLLWSIVGSFAAILYRFTHAGDEELNEPLRWLFARPLTGIIMGAIAYLILRVGLITLQPQSNATENIGRMEIMWLIAFLAGFSDRFSDYLLRTVVGRFGGNSNGDLVTIQEMSSKTTTTDSKIIESLQGFSAQDAQNNISSTSNQQALSAGKVPTTNVEISPELQTQTKVVENEEIKVNSVHLNEIKN